MFEYICLQFNMYVVIYYLFELKHNIWNRGETDYLTV